MERGPKRDLLRAPAHPYTEALLKCQPGSADPAAPLPAIPGQPPSPSAFPDGCRFHPRCPRAAIICQEQRPALRAISAQREAACHFAVAS
jgi:peptide/nickel transport system ATP-binding protein